MSDDLRPPSLRDTRRLEDVVRHHGLILSKLAPGLFGGRSRIPDPIGLSDDLAADGDPGGDGDTDEPEWWDEDRYVVTGPGTVTWLLSHAPVPESLFIRWHADGEAGVPQITPENWTLDDDGQTVAIPDPDGLLAEDDFFSAQYQFLDVVDDDPVPVVAAVALVGTTTLDNVSHTSISLPSGTEAGDILVLAMSTGGFGGVPSSADSRIVDHAVNGKNYVAYGVADGSGTALSISITDPEGNGGVTLVAYRVAGALTYDFSSGSSPMAPTMPTGSPALGVMALAYTYSSSTINTPEDGWTRDARTNGSSQNADVWESPSGTPTFSHTVDSAWAGLVIGVSDG